jgi:hypothetical protein
MRWIILKNDNTTIDNVIVADADFITQHYPNAIALEYNISAAPNDTYQDGVVIRKLPEAPVEEPIND